MRAAALTTVLAVSLLTAANNGTATTVVSAARDPEGGVGWRQEGCKHQQGREPAQDMLAHGCRCAAVLLQYCSNQLVAAVLLQTVPHVCNKAEGHRWVWGEAVAAGAGNAARRASRRLRPSHE
jgi:hypothetical protein